MLMMAIPFMLSVDYTFFLPHGGRIAIVIAALNPRPPRHFSEVKFQFPEARFKYRIAATGAARGSDSGDTG